MGATGYGDAPHVFVCYAVEFAVARGEPCVVVHGGECAEGGVVISQGLRHGVFAGCDSGIGSFTGADACLRVAVPAEGDEDVFCDVGFDGHGGGLQRSYGTCAAHLNGGGVSEVVDAEIGGEGFLNDVVAGYDESVDVVRG